MAKTSSLPSTEIIFPDGTSERSKAISRALKRGDLRRLAPKVYTSNIHDDPATILQRNLYQIIAHKFPDAVISHRTALEMRPTDNGELFITYRYAKNVKLGHLTIRALEGPTAQETDSPFIGGLTISSQARAFLENFQSARSRSGSSKTLPKEDLEERLAKICSAQSERKLNEIRDEARELAERLGWETEFAALDQTIAAILRTGPANTLKSQAAKSIAAGQPTDMARVELFNSLFAELQTDYFSDRPWKPGAPEANTNIAFFEAYFSNFIEGTEFELGEAREIVFESKIPEARPADAHDVLETYRVVGDTTEMRKLPKTYADFEASIKARHARIMAARTEKHPGEFKLLPNRAGGSYFVEPDMVRGTLNAGFDLYRGLREPFAKAVFMMFLVSEVHPFDDGNGRMARIMMNAELVHADQMRIIIPIVYRDDYLLTLKKFSRDGDATAYIRMLNRAQEYTSKIDFSSIETATQQLEATEAFLTPREGLLRMPGEGTGAP